MKKMLTCTASIILFIELIDTTILYSCLVPIADDFGISTSRTSLAILSYIVGTCIFIPIVSWLSHHYNKINIIIITLIIFALASLLCSISFELYSFSVFRFLQGIAISIAASMSIVTLLSICSSNEIVKLMGLINIPALLGTATGPFAGAIFSYYLSWRVAFLINFPICIIMALLLMPLRSQSIFSNSQLAKNSFDLLGFIIMSIFLVVTSLGFEQIGNAVNITNCFLLLSGFFFGIIYLFLWKIRQQSISTNNKYSILDLNVFKNVDFLFGVIVNIMARIAMCGLPILFSIILQQFYGFSILEAGLYFAIIAGAGIIAKFLSSLIDTIGVHRSVIASTILTSLAIIFISPIEFWIAKGDLWIPCFILGFTMSLLYTSMNSVLYFTLNKNEISNASNIGSIIQQFCIGLGVVATIKGFQLLLSLYGPSASTKIHIADAFQVTCNFAAGLMMLNSIAAISLRIYHRKKPQVYEKFVTELR